MALGFHPTTASLFGHGRLLPAPDMSFLQDDDGGVHSEVTDALLGFVYDPLDASHTALDDLLSLPPPNDDDGADDWRYGNNKRQRSNQQVPATTGALINDCDCVLQLPPPPAVPVTVPTQVIPKPEPLVFVRGADSASKAVGGTCGQSVNSTARQRRKRISDKTAELARLIPGAHKLNTAEMLEEAARHVKLLQAQVGVLALMHAAAGSSQMQEEKMPSAMARERMHALLARERMHALLAAEDKCLVPTSLVGTVAKDDDVRANPMVRRDLGRFVASLMRQGQ